MVTISIPNMKIDGGDTVASCRGLSSDTKPTDGIPINSMFVELDTGDVFYFDGTEWKTFAEEE